MELNKLPGELQSQLRSDLVARNVSNCVIELVENALDANASCVAVRINFETFRLEVVDNGTGLTKADLKLVGERYFTSKRKDAAELSQNSKHFGYRGEGLASIKNVSSRVLIISRAFDDDATYCKVIEKSNAEVVPSQHERKSVGTTVIVENFLDKLPVRQKCIKPSEEFQTIKWFLQATALMFPKVNFSLRNDNQKSDVFRIDRTNSTTSTFLELFRGAVRHPSSFLKLKTTHKDITAKIMLSQETCNTDQLQFVFINKRYLPQCDVQKYLNTLLDRIDPSKKKISRKTIYILNLSCPRDDYDVTYESDGRFVEFKNWAVVEQCLLNLVKLIASDNKPCNLEEDVKKPCKEMVPVKDAFREMNTAHTIFGLPANRQNVEKPVEVYIDDESNSPVDTGNKKEAKISKSRLLKVSKSSHKISKNSKTTKSPRLVDQGIALTFKKSPIAIRRVVEEKNAQRCSKNRDISVEKTLPSHGDYAWMWKQPDKGHDSDLTDFSDTRELVNESRVVCSKIKKDKKLLTERKRGECFKSTVALSNQRALKLPTRDRISKKQNHYFDAMENKNNVIEKYGKMNKNAQYTFNDDVNVNEPDEITNDIQWTAKISINQSTTTFPPLTLFDKQPSPELEFQDDENQCKKNVDRQSNGRFVEQHDTLVPTLPFNENYFNDRSPLLEVHQSFHQRHRVSYDLTQETLKRDVITNVEVLDPRCKVDEWISKLPRNEEILLNDSANDYLTPVKNSDQIASDFKLKTTLSKTPDNDFQSPDRTPEKRKSQGENFEPKCKLKLDFSRAKIEEYKMKKKSCSKPLNKSPFFKWNHKPVQKSRQGDNYLNDFESIQQKNEFDRAENPKVADKKNYDASKEYMSWNNLNDSTYNHENEDLQCKETRAVSTQTSDCCGQCRCRCHENPDSRGNGKSPLDHVEISNATQNISQQSVFHDDDEKDTLILTRSPLLNSPAADSEHDTVMLPKDHLNTFDFNRRNTETQFSEFDEDGKVQNSADVFAPSQRFAESLDSTKNSAYFQSKMMVEKLKFKMGSKFLENSSPLDIPKGMLESVPMNESKVEILDEDEKNAVIELVKPYRMQNHITLDDSGNSCLRIFPMFKNQNKKIDTCTPEDLNCPVVLTKEDISSFKFMAQIEKKFILASAVLQKTQTPLLILLDQHAVDERIRVERLLRDYLQNGEWQSTPVNPHIHLNIPFTYCSLFTDYRSNLEEFGLHYEFNNRTMNNEAKLIVSFTKVPTCFYNRAMKEKNNFQGVLKQSIESLTKELLKKFIKRETLVHTVPNELQSVVNYEACRGAVKFGDKLTPQVCSALLEGMGQCKLPFQCAHGRPSVVPLVSFDKLAHLQKQVWKPNFNELKAKFIR